MLKLLGIHGSPRRNGNTDILIDEALTAAMEKGTDVEKISLAELDFEGCQSCGGCDINGSCGVDDDMQRLYPKFIEFDRFIIASPIFFKNLSGLTKCFVDRFQCHWVAKYQLNEVPWNTTQLRKGAFISTCGSNRRDMFEPALATIKSLFMTLDINYSYELLVEGMDEKGVVHEHPDILEKARKLGENLAKE